MTDEIKPGDKVSLKKQVIVIMATMIDLVRKTFIEGELERLIIEFCDRKTMWWAAPKGKKPKEKDD